MPTPIGVGYRITDSTVIQSNNEFYWMSSNKIAENLNFDIGITLKINEQEIKYSADSKVYALPVRSHRESKKPS